MTVPVALRTARVATAAAFGVQGLVFAVLLTHLPQFKDRYGIGDGTVTLIVLLVSLLAGAGSVLTGRMAARSSSAAALRLGLAGVCAGAAVVALAPDRTLFVAGFAIYGLALGAVDAGGNMQAVAVQHRYGRSILTSFHAAWSAAGIAGALFVAVAERVRLPLPASVLSAVAVAALASVLAGPRLLTRGPDGDPAVRAAGRAPWRPVLVLGAAMACFYVADAGISNWSAIYLRDALGATGGTAALGYAAYQATGLLSRLVGDRVVRVVGDGTTVRAAGAIGAAGLLLAVLAPSPVVAVVAFAIVGAGLPVVAPLCFSAAGRLAPGAADAVVARVNVFNYAGAVLGGVLVGAIGAATTLRLGFAVPLVLALCLIPIARAFDRARAPAAGHPRPRPGSGGGAVGPPGGALVNPEEPS